MRRFPDTSDRKLSHAMTVKSKGKYALEMCLHRKSWND